MARPTLPLRDTLGGEIYDALLQFVDEQQAIPNAHAFWSQVLVKDKGYALSRSGFSYWWLQLQLVGLITVEPKTKAIKVKRVKLEVNQD